MKQIIITFTLILFSILSFGQGIRFDANVTNTYESQTNFTQYETVHFAFDLEDTHMYFVADSSDSFDEPTIDHSWIPEEGNRGKILQIWSEESFIEIHYTNSRNGTPRPIILYEYPYIGLVQYRQYYWNPNQKPITAHN